MGKIHNLKTEQPFFGEIKQGRKTFDLRINDRQFEVGDEVYLQEYCANDGSYSGEMVRAKIVYLLENYTGLEPGYCILGLYVIPNYI